MSERVPFAVWADRMKHTEMLIGDLRKTSERKYSFRRSNDPKITSRPGDQWVSTLTLRVVIRLFDEPDPDHFGVTYSRPNVWIGVDKRQYGTINDPLAELTERELERVIELKAMVRKWIAGEGDLLPSDVGDFDLIIE